MKHLLLLISLVFNFLGGFCQENSFQEFIRVFPKKELPYTKDNFSSDDYAIIPSELAYEYVCKEDSSKLYYERVGVNQETLEVVYRDTVPFKYRAFNKVLVDNYYLLVYDEYTEDGSHEFTTIVKIGLFKEGKLCDEMQFYVFDDTGNLQEQSGVVTPNFNIKIKRKIYDKGKNGVFKLSYTLVTKIYKINTEKGEFVKLKEESKYFKPED
ncbi:hypothetical protein L21SP5_00123 [Salinivirga cyanobacteriivorans]|uniref:Uncharacterized protein n=1 Tax=Salinivirga cyanobacteriivorans TaxID=1307839 RepID=A0A0S2HUR5_9BACT|nr:hypothetical protein [Salinivirga cyanobacteriivorans]ALO13805.1 hypothetical protein L21SP5_00123 [Salinivirga cyanobacteriivorans]